MQSNIEIIKHYYHCFNSRNWQGMLSLVSDQVQHDSNQGETRIGKTLFAEFMQIMDEHYEEKVVELNVFQAENSARLAAEFFIDGVYKKSQPGLPPAHGQTYYLRVGAFFEIEQGKIARITNYYNLPKWIELVSK